MTNETLCSLTERPEHLVIVGGGPIGVEMAQAFRRLGSAVTVLQRGRLLPHDEPELVGIVRERLVAAGITLREGAEFTGVARDAAGVVVRYGVDGEARGTHLLLAAGRQPRLAGLALDRAGIAYTPPLY